MEPGGSAGQARLEALTLLISVATWRPLLAASQGTLTFVGDALGVLHDALRFKAREPVLNGIISEMALEIAPFRADLRAAHVWSERNSLCDALSRLTAGGQLEHPQ